MTPCLVKWCGALALNTGGLCAVHAVLPDYSPKMPDASVPEGRVKCSRCGGDAKCAECDRECLHCNGLGHVDDETIKPKATRMVQRA